MNRTIFVLFLIITLITPTYSNANTGCDIPLSNDGAGGRYGIIRIANEVNWSDADELTRLVNETFGVNCSNEEIDFTLGRFPLPRVMYDDKIDNGCLSENAINYRIFAMDFASDILQDLKNRHELLINENFSQYKEELEAYETSGNDGLDEIIKFYDKKLAEYNVTYQDEWYEQKDILQKRIDVLLEERQIQYEIVSKNTNQLIIEINLLRGNVGKPFEFMTTTTQSTTDELTSLKEEFENVTEINKIALDTESKKLLDQHNIALSNVTGLKSNGSIEEVNEVLNQYSEEYKNQVIVLEDNYANEVESNQKETVFLVQRLVTLDNIGKENGVYTNDEQTEINDIDTRLKLLTTESKDKLTKFNIAKKKAYDNLRIRSEKLTNEQTTTSVLYEQRKLKVEHAEARKSLIDAYNANLQILSDNYNANLQILSDNSIGQETGLIAEPGNNISNEDVDNYIALKVRENDLQVKLYNEGWAEVEKIQLELDAHYDSMPGNEEYMIGYEALRLELNKASDEFLEKFVSATTLNLIFWETDYFWDYKYFAEKRLDVGFFLGINFETLINDIGLCSNQEYIDRDQELIYGEMMFHVSSVAALLNEIKGLSLEFMYDKEYLFCTTVNGSDTEYCNSTGSYWDYSNYPEILN